MLEPAVLAGLIRSCARSEETKMADEQSKSGLQDCEQRQSESAAGVGGNASHAEADTTKQLSKKKGKVEKRLTDIDLSFEKAKVARLID